MDRKPEQQLVDAAAQQISASLTPGLVLNRVFPTRDCGDYDAIQAAADHLENDTPFYPIIFTSRGRAVRAPFDQEIAASNHGRVSPAEAGFGDPQSLLNGLRNWLKTVRH